MSHVIAKLLCFAITVGAIQIFTYDIWHLRIYKESVSWLNKSLVNTFKYVYNKSKEWFVVMFKNINYPVAHTFKIVGDNCSTFISAVGDVFELYDDKEMSNKHSSNGKYVSLSVTVDITTLEEMKYLYTEIYKVDGLKFHA